MAKNLSAPTGDKPGNRQAQPQMSDKGRTLKPGQRQDQAQNPVTYGGRKAVQPGARIDQAQPVVTAARRPARTRG